jgi:hypothetical protein
MSLGTSSESVTGGDVFVGASSVASEMRVVNSRVEGDRGSGSGIRVALLVDHLLKIIDRHSHLIQNHRVVDRSCGSLNSNMRVEVKVKHEWVSDFLLNKSTRQRVAVLVSLLREEADVVTLCGNDDREFGHLAGRKDASEVLLDLRYLLLQYMRELAFTNAIAEID